jgi:hypothetical protein
MIKSNFVEPNSNPIQAMAHVDAARKYTSIFMNADMKGYSQWFSGKSNNVVDALSRDWHHNKEELTLYFMLSFLQTDARKFLFISTAQQDQLMADLSAAAASRE